MQARTRPGRNGVMLATRHVGRHTQPCLRIASKVQLFTVAFRAKAVLLIFECRQVFDDSLPPNKSIETNCLRLKMYRATHCVFAKAFGITIIRYVLNMFIYNIQDVEKHVLFHSLQSISWTSARELICKVLERPCINITFKN